MLIIPTEKKRLPTMIEIKKHKELAQSTKKNLKRKRHLFKNGQPIEMKISLINLIGYCDDTITLCNIIIEIEKKIPK